MKGSHKANCKVHESQRQKNFSEHTWPKCCFPKSGASRSSKTCLGPQSAVTFMSFHSDWGLLSLQDKEQAWTLSWCEIMRKNTKKSFVRTFMHMARVYRSMIFCVGDDYIAWNSTCTRTVNSPVGVLLGSWTETHPKYAIIPKSWQWTTLHKLSTAVDVYILSWGLKLRPMICRQIRIQAQVCHLKTQQPVCWQQTLQQPLASNCNVYVKRRKKSNQT